jgi:hypothetical protein
MASKMAELKFEAPLAQFEETEEWGVIAGDFQQHQLSATSVTLSEDNFIHQDARNSNNCNKEVTLGGLLSTSTNNGMVVLPSQQLSQQFNDNDALLQTAQQLTASEQKCTHVQNQLQQNGVGHPPCTGGGGGSEVSVADNFTETFSGSLEDLVNTFDDKITRCFCNYDESVEKLAPVQVRTQEEIMNECQ